VLPECNVQVTIECPPLSDQCSQNHSPSNQSTTISAKKAIIKQGQSSKVNTDTVMFATRSTPLLRSLQNTSNRYEGPSQMSTILASGS